jgi:hypothetical protein
MSRMHHWSEQVIAKRFDTLTAPSNAEGLREAKVLVER